MAKDKFGLIIQARTGSSRLPKKIVLPVDGDKTFLHILLERLSSLSDKIQVVVATSVNEGDDEIERIANSFEIPVFRGSENNVLDRFVTCAENFGIENIVRVCSDNPFIDLDAIETLVSEYSSEDYLSYSIDGKPSILTHFGFFAELVSLKALRKVLQTGDSACVEHVTNCIHSNQEKFNVRFIRTTISNVPIRCTLDTDVDFLVLKQVYFHWYQKKADPRSSYRSLIQYLEGQPQLISQMENQIKQNSK